jgi:hypothetical protein
MMHKRFLLRSALSILSVSLCEPSTPGLKETPPQQSHAAAQEISLGVSLAELLSNYHSAGSIIVRGQCTNANFIKDDIGNPPAGKFRSLDKAVMEWTKAVPRLTAHHDPNGMWRIVDTTASAQLLKLRIHDLWINAFDGVSAIGGILDTNEVKQFFDEYGFSQASTIGGPAPFDPSQLPHSILHLHDVTVAEAFDAVVKKYPGLWVYWECVSPSDNRKLIEVRALSF